MLAQNTFNPDDYLTITALEDDLQVSFTNSVKYSLDGLKWNTLNPNELTPYNSKGSQIYFKRFHEPNSGSVGTFSVTKKFALSGNIMSIIFGDNVKGKVDLTGYNFQYLFNNVTTLLSISENFLPATVLSDNCYAYMFYGCTSLVTAPELPATVLGGLCYQSMFYNCSNLNSKIVLPAITLQNQSYMMTFNNCKQINNITLLTTDAPSKKTMRDCFKGVASEGTIILNKNIEWDPEIYRNGKTDKVEGSVTLNETITWGFPGTPETWPIKYCDPDDITDVRDQPW